MEGKEIYEKLKDIPAEETGYFLAKLNEKELENYAAYVVDLECSSKRFAINIESII